MDKKIIFYILAIVAVLGVVFMGQQAYFRQKGGELVSSIGGTAGAYLSKGASWVTSKVFSVIGGGVQSGEELIENKVNETKQNISENISEAKKNTTEKVQNYFTGVGDSILGKENNNCQPCQTPASQ